MLGEGSSHQSQPPSPTSCISRKFLRPYRLASYFLQSTSSPKSGMWGSLRVALGRGETGKLLPRVRCSPPDPRHVPAPPRPQV